MKYEAGQDVIVVFDGEECLGEVINHANGWVTAKILIDTSVDFGQIGRNMSPISYVAVRERDVKRISDDDRPQ